MEPFFSHLAPSHSFFIRQQRDTQCLCVKSLAIEHMSGFRSPTCKYWSDVNIFPSSIKCSVVLRSLHLLSHLTHICYFDFSFSLTFVIAAVLKQILLISFYVCYEVECYGTFSADSQIL